MDFSGDAYLDDFPSDHLLGHGRRNQKTCAVSTSSESHNSFPVSDMHIMGSLYLTDNIFFLSNVCLKGPYHSNRF